MFVFRALARREPLKTTKIAWPEKGTAEIESDGEERDRRNVINQQGYEIISKNFEEDFPKSSKHLLTLYNKEEFQEFMKGYLDGILH